MNYIGTVINPLISYIDADINARRIEMIHIYKQYQINGWFKASLQVKKNIGLKTLPAIFKTTEWRKFDACIKCLAQVDTILKYFM